jgi:hypothetical protein
MVYAVAVSNPHNALKFEPFGGSEVTKLLFIKSFNIYF